ncbi:MAG: hypothetical protein Q9225_007214, partial [Loekoesia sp. 1 TL-2023]
HDVFAEGLVGVVAAEFVGENPGDVGFCGGFDEFGLLFRWGADAHGDDEGVLAAEGGDESGWVVVVHFLDFYTGGHFGRASFTGNGGDFLFAIAE